MSHYTEAESLIKKAWQNGGETSANFSRMAQAQATLALVDEIRDMRSFVAEYLAASEDVMSTGIKEVVADEVSSALLEAFTRRDGHTKGSPV